VIKSAINNFVRKNLNKNRIRFSVVDRLRSFRFAFSGLKQFFQTQHNAIIHAVATLVVIIAGFLVKLSSTEWTLIAIAITMVWAAELFNTAIEALCDMVMPEKHPQIKFIKDVAAAAVLMSAIGAVVIGLVIFIPKIVSL
jgi:diacylglycerol kinase